MTLKNTLATTENQSVYSRMLLIKFTDMNKHRPKDLQCFHKHFFSSSTLRTILLKLSWLIFYRARSHVLGIMDTAKLIAVCVDFLFLKSVMEYHQLMHNLLMLLGDLVPRILSRYAFVAKLFKIISLRPVIF